VSAKLAIVPKDEEQHVITIDGHASRELMATIALGALRGAVAFLKARLETAGVETPAASPPPLAATESDRDVMTADEVAAFLGVDRNTVYDYAGRGVIPHQRLGKRILFRRGALVSWLDASCKATSTRKG
jgi:excisionase family DNA binding protein